MQTRLGVLDLDNTGRTRCLWNKNAGRYHLTHRQIGIEAIEGYVVSV